MSDNTREVNNEAMTWTKVVEQTKLMEGFQCEELSQQMQIIHNHGH